MRPAPRLTLAFVAFAVLPLAAAKPEPASVAQTSLDPTQAAVPYLDIPISQSVNRDGVIRYAVWVKIGARSVQAMVDTGSTGLRVLPSVFPGDVTGVPTDIAFGAGMHMEGLAIAAPVEIGSLKGTVPIEVVTHISCVTTRPDCDVTNLGSDAYLIGGDGYPSEGYSAILGIGFPFQGTDLGNPLESLGVKRWIVDLPRPYEETDGHLILDPDTSTAGAFDMLARNGIADADGCIAGAPLSEAKCGTILFDTGAPGIDLSFEGVETASLWDDGAAGTLRFTGAAKGTDAGTGAPKTFAPKTFALDFQTGRTGGPIGVSITPPHIHDLSEPFILAGVVPFFTYDILYDQATHTVGLRTRRSMPAPATGAPFGGGSDGPSNQSATVDRPAVSD